MMDKKIVNFIVLLGALFLGAVSGSVNAGSIEQQRKLFAQTEQLLLKGKETEAKENMQLLQDYALLPYLQYLLLKRNLQQDTAIQEYLSLYGETTYADRLRRLWLQDLLRRQHWWGFLRHYKESSNKALICQYQWALYNTGKQQQALDAAAKLWLVGYSQPDECNALFTKFKQAGLLSNSMVWERFDLALQKNNVSLAKYLLGVLKTQDQDSAEFWLKVHNNPDLIINDAWRSKYSHDAEIFSHGVERLARKDREQAISLWDKQKNAYDINAKTRERVATKLALSLAYNREPAAYFRLAALSDESQKVREWRVRAALRAQNWQHVEAALKRLNKDEQQSSKWLYWQGRALSKTGHAEQARLAYKAAAQDRSFYGFMAAEYNGIPYHFADQPIVIKPGDMDALLATTNFAMVNEFKMLQRKTDALRVWWYALKQLDVEQIEIAAKLAKMWQWNHIAVFTVAKAKSWDDLKLRFPVLYADTVQKNAQIRGLDPSVVFGLIRQESVFNAKARSPAGAKGLMQIMPATGKQIARELNERWRSSSKLYNPDVNIKYGTYYYKQLLNKFDGQYALAAAGYNAGPHRVKHWLPEYGTLPVDIWIETIPFNETRKYVAKVLAYALIYQNQTGRDTLKMQDFMHNVQAE